MKLPDSVKIGGRIYEIRFPFRFKDSSEITLGMIDHTSQRISICDIDQHGNERTEYVILHTLLHEILHGIDYVYNGNRIFECEGGDKVIDQLAEGLLQVLRDNEINFSPSMDEVTS